MLPAVWIFSLRSFFVVVVTYLLMVKDTVFTVASPNDTALHCCHEKTLSAWTQTLTAFLLMIIGAFTVIVLPLKIWTFLTYTILLLLATSFTVILKLSILTVLFVIFTMSSFLTRLASAAGRVTKAIIATIVASMPNAAWLFCSYALNPSVSFTSSQKFWFYFETYTVSLQYWQYFLNK
jgi:hypothetical protein